MYGGKCAMGYITKQYHFKDGHRATPPAQAGDYVTATPLYMYIFTVHQQVHRLELISSFYMILSILVSY